MTKITRAFNYKLALPNFENRDFYCSQEIETNFETMEELTEVSEKVYEWCKNQVMKSVNEYLKEIKGEQSEQAELDLPTTK